MTDIKYEDVKSAIDEMIKTCHKYTNLRCRNCGEALISSNPYRMGYCEECWEKGYGDMPEFANIFDSVDRTADNVTGGYHCKIVKGDHE